MLSFRSFYARLAQVMLDQFRSGRSDEARLSVVRSGMSG
jgi:hypothetical protein